MSSSVRSAAHSAYMVWRVITDRAILKVAPSLGKKSNAQLIFSIVMLIVTLLGAIGAGIVIDGYGISPPTSYTGICAPPASIVHNGKDCYAVVPEVITRSGTVTTTTVSISTGIIQYQTSVHT